MFRNGGYEVHRIDAPSPVDTRWNARGSTRPRRAAGDDGGGRRRHRAGAAAARDAPAQRDRSDYRPRLSLEGIGSPYFSAGGGPLGSYVSGGASLLFGDLLGDHQLLTAAYISSRLDESAVGAMYVNRTSRWNWGVSIEQTPDLRVRTTGAELDPTREHAVTRTRERMLWTTRRLGGFAAYPLSRSRRVEIHGGIRRARFLARPADRARLDAIRHGVRRPKRGRSAACPRSASPRPDWRWSATQPSSARPAPLVGSRYRLQATANVGGLQYASVLADYRTYVMPVRPYTVALRVVHTGRYGGDASDFRLRDAYVGAPTLVRGYGAREVVRVRVPVGQRRLPGAEHGCSPTASSPPSSKCGCRSGAR